MTAVLLANGPRHAPRSLLVTSAQPGDGKTTVASNLAISLARLGGRVLLVDADTRRPAVHRAFGIAVDRGLGEALRGEAAWPTLVRHDVVPGLDILFAGLRLRASTDLLASERLPMLLQEARQGYEYVVLDSPALGINAADTRILATLVDGVVMVVRSGTTPEPLVRTLIRRLPNMVGLVLNDVDHRRFPAYYYAYADDVAPAAPV
jgi:capsular exopolysaccharide synthesis family protein